MHLKRYSKYHDLFLNPWRFLRFFRYFIENILSLIPYFVFFKTTRKTENPISLTIWFNQKILGYNKHAYWPMHLSSQVSYSQRVLIGKNVFPGYQFGCYIHGINGVYIDDYTFIAPNVSIMSANHVLNDLRNQTVNSPIKIGKYCWLGMNSVILPEVELGDFTIVGAGSVVTKSFKGGFCVIAGNPAKLIKELNPENCIRYNLNVSHIGYINYSKFNDYRKNKLDV
jgi:acetyltransferase-like isoleucine patch superfamily enzyme